MSWDNYKANMAILSLLKDLIGKYPELSFGQILYNFSLVRPIVIMCHVLWNDEFYTDSEILLQRLQNGIKEHK